MKFLTTILLLGALSTGDDSVRATEFKKLRLEYEMWPYTEEENDRLS